MKKSFLFEKIDPISRLIEMVILFFAISLGFIVENYREDYSEQLNSEKLISSLLKDLKGDLIRFDEFTELRKTLIKDVYSFIDDVEKNGLKKNDLDQQILFAKAIFSWTYFKPNKANIEQIISSGALRYLGEDDLIYQIGIIEASTISIIDRQEREQEYFLNYLQPLMHKYYNFKWLNNNYVRKWEPFVNSIAALKKNQSNTKEYMFWEEDKNLEKRIINLFENYVFILRSSFFVSYDEYINQVNKTIALIETKN
ncbi:MAG: hypothetical protein VW125_08585 [Flavobacteriaceae bacterium]